MISQKIWVTEKWHFHSVYGFSKFSHFLASKFLEFNTVLLILFFLYVKTFLIISSIPEINGKSTKQGQLLLHHSVEIVEICSQLCFHKEFVKSTHIRLPYSVICIHEIFFKWEWISCFSTLWTYQYPNIFIVLTLADCYKWTYKLTIDMLFRFVIIWFDGKNECIKHSVKIKEFCY